MDDIKISKLLPIFIVIMIPISFVLLFVYNIYLNDFISKQDFTTEELKIFLENKMQLPLGELLTFGSVVIPAIVVRKAVREGTHNKYVKTYDSEQVSSNG